MKRAGHLYDKICHIKNIIKAEKKARKGKTRQAGVILFDDKRKSNLIELHRILQNKEFKNSEYDIFTIKEKKERVIYKLPYFPDRIVHHAILNILEPIFVKSFTSDTYSCIKKRGIHTCLRKLNESLQDKDTTYCLKLDIKKFYPSINHDILKKFLLKKFKDDTLLNLLYEIIDSADGLPIGNYLSQYLANFYLTYFDHWIKENKKVKHYFRYCDDLVILGNNKEFLHGLRKEIQKYLEVNLRLELSNYQVFPVHKRGVDFVGYRSYHTHVLLRKSIKHNWIKMLTKYPNRKSIASYNGWLSHCNSNNLQAKYLKS